MVVVNNQAIRPGLPGMMAYAKLASVRMTAKAAEAKRTELSEPNIGLGPFVKARSDRNQATRTGLPGMIAKAKNAAEITTEKAAANRRFEAS
jgi:hypothetical protein